MADETKGHRQRLKDRFVGGRPEAHTEEALLELLLTYAIPQKDLQPLARHLIADFGGLGAVLAVDRAALTRIRGLGDAAITLLKLAHHLATVDIPEGLPQSAPSWISQPPLRSTDEEGQLASATGTGRSLAPPAAISDDASPELPASAPAPRAVAGRERTPVAEPEATPPRPAASSTRWRAAGRYSAANMLKPGMIAETQLALAAYARLRDLDATRRYLQDEGLPQRSRATRRSIVTTIGERLTSWNPPQWVCQDLIETSAANDLANLKPLLLAHAARQDVLLYTVVQRVIVPRWHEGVVAISHVEMQRFLDEAAPSHPEIATWSRATRGKLTGNLLTVLRDYGLLVGAATKRIVEPVIPPRAASHLARLLQEEGIEAAHLPYHPDWALWLLTPERVRALLAAMPAGGTAT